MNVCMRIPRIHPIDASLASLLSQWRSPMFLVNMRICTSMFRLLPVRCRCSTPSAARIHIPVIVCVCVCSRRSFVIGCTNNQYCNPVHVFIASETSTVLHHYLSMHHRLGLGCLHSNMYRSIDVSHVDRYLCPCLDLHVRRWIICQREFDI